MNIKELKEKIKDLPDEMLIGLIDDTTDDTDDMNYGILDYDVEVDNAYDIESGEENGKMVFIHFQNKLNENSILNQNYKLD